MSTQATDIARRRKALHVGLTGALDEAQVLVALRLWDQAFAQQRPGAIIEFVAQLSSQLGLPPKQRHEMRMGIYQALLRYDAGREPIPETRPAGARGATNAVASLPATPLTSVRGPAEYAVFHALLQQLMDGLLRIEALARHDVIQSLQQQQGRSVLSSGLHSALIQWVRDDSGLGAYAAEPAEVLSDAVHALYVALCMAVGPVATDQLLARAVRAAEGLPEAARFKPQRLL